MCVSGICEGRHKGIYADNTKQPEQEAQTQKEGPLPANLWHRPAVQTRRVVSLQTVFFIALSLDGKQTNQTSIPKNLPSKI